MRPLTTALLFIVSTAASVCCSQLWAAEERALEPIAVGQPTRIEVFPPAVKLAGPRGRMQLVVTGHYADGSVQDLTRASQFASTAAEIVAVENAVALPRQNGKAEIAVIAGGRAAIVPVEVEQFGDPQQVSFEFN